MLDAITFAELFTSESAIAVYSFLAQYMGEKTLDFFLQKKDGTLSANELLAKQLYESLNEALLETCKRHDWEYDGNAIEELFCSNTNFWLDIDSQEGLIHVLKLAVGDEYSRIVTTEIAQYWLEAFKQSIACHQQLFNYLHEKNNSYPSTKKVRYLTDFPPLVQEENFIGRDYIMSDLRHKLLSCNAKISLFGAGGIGKTTVATAIFQEIAEEFDALAWVSYVDNLDISLANSFCELKNMYSSEEERVNAVWNILRNGNHKLLLVIDNVEITDSSLQKLLTLPIKVVLTSRTYIENFTPIKIDELNLPDCISVFIHYYAYTQDNMDKDIVGKIVDRCFRNTLVIELAAKGAKAMKTRSLEAYFSKLDKGGFGEIQGKICTNHERSPYIAIEHLKKLFNILSVSREQEYILQCFALMPSVEISGDIYKWINCNLDDLLSLEKLGWIEGTNKGYKMHPLVKETICLENIPENVVDFFVQYLATNGAAMFDNQISYTEMSSIFQVIEALLSKAGSHIKTTEQFAAACYNVGKGLQEQGYINEALNYYQKALFIRESNLRKNQLGIAEICNEIAMSFKIIEEYGKAVKHIERARIIREEFLGENHLDTAKTYNDCGLIYQEMEEYNDALKYYQKAYSIKMSLSGDNRLSISKTYNNMAGLLRDMGDYNGAIKNYEEALAIRKIVLGNDHPETAKVYHNMGVLFYCWGNFEKAKSNLEEALRIKELRLPEKHPSITITYKWLSSVYEALNQTEKAEEYDRKFQNNIIDPQNWICFDKT